MSLNWIPLTLLSAIVLMGCSRTPDVPDSVQKMMEAEIPADGQIHVRSRRRIIIRQETPTCYFSDGFIVDSGDLFRALGQRRTLDGASRFRPVDRESQCSIQPDTVYMKGDELPNSRGGRYKLMLAVWQGDQERGGAAWVGGIERPDGVRPDSRELQAFRDGLPSPSWARESEDRDYRIGVSVERDVNDLSEAFTRDVSKAGH
jgi:hypothetical protein